jgi:hypothetical protein
MKNRQTLKNRNTLKNSRRIGRIAWIGLSFFLLNGRVAVAQKKWLESDEEQMEKIRKNFCNLAWPQYMEIKNWIATHKEKPEIPVPPAMDVQCYDCTGPRGEDKNEARAQAFIEASAKPESDMIRTLLSIQRAFVLLGGKDVYALNEDANQPACMRKMSNFDFNEKIMWLLKRIYEGKALAMARKYYTHPEMEYAGTRFLLACGREIGLYGGDNSEAPEYYGKWLQAYFSTFEDRLTRQYQYQLYPRTISLVRELDLATGSERHDELGYKMYDWRKRLGEFMHFSLRVSFEAVGHGENGVKYHAKVTGETEVACLLPDSACMRWETIEGGNMTFRVEEVVFQSDQGMARYKGPQTFTVPVTVEVDVCNESPRLKLSLDRFGAEEETYVSGEGAEFQTPLLYSLAMATLGSGNMGKMLSQANELNANADMSPAGQRDVDAAAKRMRAHDGDTNYIKTAQGKADLKLMQQMSGKMGGSKNWKPNDPSMRPDAGRMKNLDNLHKMNEAYRARDAKLTQAGYIGSEAYYQDQAKIDALRGQVDMQAITRPVGLNLNPLTIEMPFQTGVPQVVDQVRKDKVAEVAGSSGSWDFGQFHVTMENKPAH